MRDEEGKRKGFDRPRDSYLERDDLSELDWQDKQLAAVDARLLRETPGAAPETGRLAMQTDRTAGGEQPDEDGTAANATCSHHVGAESHLTSVGVWPRSLRYPHPTMGPAPRVDVGAATSHNHELTSL